MKAKESKAFDLRKEIRKIDPKLEHVDIEVYSIIVKNLEDDTDFDDDEDDE